MRCDKLCLLAVLMVVMVAVLAPAPMSAQGPFKISPKDETRGPGGGGCEVAGTVLIEQPPNQSNGIFTDADCDICGGAQVLAENFVLTATQTIDTIVLWTGYFPANIPLPVDNWTVIFHQDTGGLPGATISTETGVPNSKVTTGLVLFGVNEYRDTLTLANPVTLGAGTWWIEAFNDSTGSTESVFWEVGDQDPVNGISGSAFASEAPGVSWFAGGDLAFCLVETAAVPTLTPIWFAALALVLMAITLVALVRRQRA